MQEYGPITVINSDAIDVAIYGGAANTSTRVVASATPPSDPKTGTLWYRTDSYIGLYIWLVPPSAWVQARL